MSTKPGSADGGSAPRVLLMVAAAVAALVFSPTADAHSFVTLHDDGTIAAFRDSTGTPGQVSADVMRIYDASGTPRPQIISVWSTFDFDANSQETIFLAQSNDVTGIGLKRYYGVDTFSSPYPPVEMILIHNNVLELTARAEANRAPVSDTLAFAQYLFLLELGHKWGPAIVVPGNLSGELIGYPFHWSFWLDSGGSPLGGNTWQDVGDGGFATVPTTPAAMRYSPLDLYLMGLADSSTVPPFTVLENPIPPATPKDPFTGAEYAAISFPDFDPTPLRVQATAKVWTIDDVINANGTRSPTHTNAPNSWTLGIVLLVPMGANDATVATYQSTFDPIADSLVQAFALATGGLGSLQNISSPDLADAGPDAGADAGADAGIGGGESDGGRSDGGISDAGVFQDAGPNVDAGTMDAGGENLSNSGCGCGPGGPTSLFDSTVLLMVLGLLVLRRARQATSK